MMRLILSIRDKLVEHRERRGMERRWRSYWLYSMGWRNTDTLTLWKEFQVGERLRLSKQRHDDEFCQYLQANKLSEADKAWGRKP